MVCFQTDSGFHVWRSVDVVTPVGNSHQVFIDELYVVEDYPIWFPRPGSNCSLICSVGQLGCKSRGQGGG